MNKKIPLFSLLGISLVLLTNCGYAQAPRGEGLEKLNSYWDNGLYDVRIKEGSSLQDFTIFRTFFKQQVDSLTISFNRLMMSGKIDITNVENIVAEKDAYLMKLYENYKLIKKEFPSTVDNYRKEKERVGSGNCDSVGCNNINFASGTFIGWNGYYALNNACVNCRDVIDITGGPLGNVTLAANDPLTGYTPTDYQLKITSAGLFDQIVDSIPQISPFGGQHAVMLGDSTLIERGMAILSQTFKVTPYNDAFSYQYAVFLEQPQPRHTYWDQAFFTVAVLDSAGDTIPTCGEYNVVSGYGTASFVGVKYSGIDSVFYRDWTFVSVPLKKYVGQCVTIVFEVGDCNQSGHFGYAYVTASCTPAGLIASSPAVCGQDTITLTAPPGDSAYQWWTKNGNIVGSDSTQTIFVNDSGTYTVRLIPITGVLCTDTLSKYIGKRPGPIPKPAFHVPSVCAGDSVTFINTSDTIIGQFYWDFYNIGIYQDSLVTEPKWAYPLPGTYVAKLDEIFNGCGAYTYDTIHVDSAVEGSFTAVTACVGYSTTFNNNTKGAITYYWNFGDINSPNDTASTFNAAHVYNTPGNYVVKMIASNGGPCPDTVIEKISIISPSQPPVITGPKEICQDSVVELQATPGFSSYLWLPGSYASQTIYAQIDSTTNFSLQVISNTCMDTLYAFYKVDMLNNATPTINPPSDSLCLGDSVPLTVKGGNTYLWSNGATTNSIFGQAPNTYTVTVSNNGRCPGRATATIYPKLGKASIVQPTDSICKGDSVLLTAEGGNTYLWSNGLTTSSIYAKDTVQAIYTVTVSTNQRCPGTATTNIYIKTPLVGLTLSRDNFCAGDTTTLTATGGTIFHWSNGATTSSITVKPDTTGPFSVAITNACGTKSLLDTVHVINLPVPAINGPSAVCMDSSATLTGSGGTTYVWSNGETTSSITINKLTKATTYTLTAFNGPCPGQTSTTITILPPPNVTISPGEDTTLCTGESINLKATGGGTYVWNTTPALTSDSIWVSPTSAFSYMVTVTNVCVASASRQIDVDIPSLSVNPDTTIFIGDTALLLAYSQSANTKFTWTPNYYLSCNTCPAPLANPPQTTTYTVVAVDGKGCAIDKIVTVYVEPHCYDFIVPNVFTPNGDGINDYLVIKALELYENVHYSDLAFSITIYDRWGKVMFKSTNPAEPWDGNTPSGTKASDGVYFYTITSSCQTNGQAFTYDKKGFVQLIR